MTDGPVTLVTHVCHFVGPGAVRRLGDGTGTVACHDPSFSDPQARRAFETEHPGAATCAAVEPEALAAEVQERFGRIDALVSNDPFPAERAPVDEADPERLRAALDQLMVWPFRLIGAVVPGMKRRRAGRIVIVSSAAPLVGIANYSMYAAARGGANALVPSLARELARWSISVNGVAPNYIKSKDYFPPELLADEAAMAKMLKNIPLGRLGEPEEVAELIALLAGERCGFLTGQVIPIAGGWA